MDFPLKGSGLKLSCLAVRLVQHTAQVYHVNTPGAILGVTVAILCVSFWQSCNRSSCNVICLLCPLCLQWLEITALPGAWPWQLAEDSAPTRYGGPRADVTPRRFTLQEYRKRERLIQSEPPARFRRIKNRNINSRLMQCKFKLIKTVYHSANNWISIICVIRGIWLICWKKKKKKKEMKKGADLFFLYQFPGRCCALRLEEMGGRGKEPKHMFWI